MAQGRYSTRNLPRKSKLRGKQARLDERIKAFESVKAPRHEQHRPGRMK